MSYKCDSCNELIKKRIDKRNKTHFCNSKCWKDYKKIRHDETHADVECFQCKKVIKDKRLDPRYEKRFCGRACFGNYLRVKAGKEPKKVVSWKIPGKYTHSCLKCDKSFKSTSKFIRVCDPCKKQDFWSDPYNNEATVHPWGR